MADFRETLEVKKNSTCFLSYSFCWTKEDLATEEGMLPNPPMEIEFDVDATLGEVADLIENFCETADKCQAAIDALFNNGRIRISEEY